MISPHEADDDVMNLTCASLTALLNHFWVRSFLSFIFVGSSFNFLRIGESIFISIVPASVRLSVIGEGDLRIMAKKQTDSVTVNLRLFKKNMYLYLQIIGM